MDTIKVYIFDINKYTLSSLMNLVVLNEDNLKRMNSFLTLEKRKQFLASLYLKQKFIGAYKEDENSKPISDNVYFNISHSANLVVLAISEKQMVGIDIENVDEVSEKIIKYVSSLEEQQYIRNNINFYQIWTNKESLMKCIGTGLDKKANEINALPISGVRTYLGKSYFTNNFMYKNFIFSITLQGEEGFVINSFNLL